MTTVEELRDAYGKTWEIEPLPTYGAAAWRKIERPRIGHWLNTVIAGSLDELAAKLAQQDGPRPTSKG
ncbi:hypothetical protein [Nonomuraea sp. NPDC052265]|uniref:hypothetical protein n=1 Tax=Nonomuraea sp. NPDC052265 TaxID=3364374 RepID=UPI0037C686AB